MEIATDNTEDVRAMVIMIVASSIFLIGMPFMAITRQSRSAVLAVTAGLLL